MTVFDYNKLMLLDPLLDYPTSSPADVKFHKQFGVFFNGMAIFFVAILVLMTWDINDSWWDHVVKLPPIAGGVWCSMFALGMVLQFFQSRSIDNQPEIHKKIKKESGRKRMPRIEYGEDPFEDTFAKKVLDTLMQELGLGICAADGYEIVSALLPFNDMLFKSNYERNSLTHWLFYYYRNHFSEFAPDSMAKSNRDEDLIQKGTEGYTQRIRDIVDRLKRKE